MDMHFEANKDTLARQYDSPAWLPESGLFAQELAEKIQELTQSSQPKAIIKAKSFAFIAENARLAIDREDIFQDKLDAVGILRNQRIAWEKEIKAQHLSQQAEQVRIAWSELGTYKANSDYSHTSPNTRAMLRLGIPGLLARVEKAAEKPGLTPEQQEFYESCRIVLAAMSTAAKRLAAAIQPYNRENSDALMHIATAAPQNIYEAMQLLVLYFFMHDYIGGTRVRTLGRLDVLLYPFYQKDIEAGTYTRAEIKEMLKYFLHKFWSAKVPYDLPFCLSGLDANGQDVTNELSYLIVQTYNEMHIYSPKLHIRVNDKTPADFIKLVLSCIRGGNSSFVFVNDNTAINGLLRVGIEKTDVWDYVPIGCYEPAVWGMEIGCTGNGGINLVKAVEQVFTCKDLTAIDTFEAFCQRVKENIAEYTRQATGYVTAIETFYPQINPDPLLSCQYDHSVETGVDVYSGGAKYNNSSMTFYSIAPLADCLCAVKTLVFEKELFSLSQLGQMLSCNWEGFEKERALALSAPKYGNNDPRVDEIAVDFSHYCASLVNNKPNGRGGVFKAALYTIDHCFKLGLRTGATPDGRLAGQPLSKNLCATTGMDRKGITALIHSAGKIDASLFPNGSVLDVVLHPTAVGGTEGLDAFFAILVTYFKKGGLALHGNVFNAEDLKKAQKEPVAYKNLQVRVCGWNAYFVNLSKEEQDAFIIQAENV